MSTPLTNDSSTERTLLKFLEERYEALGTFTITGQPYSLKNRQIINCRGKFPRIIKSKEARAFLKEVKKQIPDEYKNLRLGAIDEPLALIVVIYYTSRRPDLDTHAIKDGLQAAGVIQNDRYIREEHAFGFLDKENPRSEITILSIPDRDQIPHPTKEDTCGHF